MGTRTGTSYTGTMTGQVGSLITVLDAILVTGEGWTKPYTGTNKAVYQMPGGSGFVVRVLDDGSLAGSAAREAVVRAGEGATDVDTLTNPFPQVAQVGDTLCNWRKSDTADATTRNYYAVADDRYVVIAVNFGTTTFDVYRFGDIETPRSDQYATLLTVRGAANSSSAGLSMAQTVTSQWAGTFGGIARSAFARTFSGLLLSPYASAGISIGNTALGTATGATVQYPGDGLELDLRPLLWGDNGSNSSLVSAENARIRGCSPFEFEPQHGNTMGSISNLDTFTDTDYDASSNFLFVSSSNTIANNSGRTVLQTAGTWDSGV